MEISKKIYKELIKLENENCGFIYGYNYKINKINKIKNIAKKFNRFKMKKSEVFLFILKNFFELLKKDFVLGIYHVHTIYGYLSEEDKKNMIPGIIYILVYNDQLFFFEKRKNSIIKLDFIIKD